MGEYGDGRSTSSRDALSDNAMRFMDEYSVLFVRSVNHIPPYIIHVCHDSTTMTSKTSENTIQFSVLVYPMLAQKTGWCWHFLRHSSGRPAIVFLPFLSFLILRYELLTVNCQSAF